MRNHLLISTLGLLTGFLLLHPASMVFQGMIHPDIQIRLDELMRAFNIHHLPMAFFFGLLGAAFGLIISIFNTRLLGKQARIGQLERLLPICAYCRKIRDSSNAQKDEWMEIDRYITKHTDSEVTHGMCPDCHETVMKELDEEDSADDD